MLEVNSAPHSFVKGVDHKHKSTSFERLLTQTAHIHYVKAAGAGRLIEIHEDVNKENADREHSALSAEQSLLSKVLQFDELEPTGMAKVMMINGIQFTIRLTKCRIMLGFNDRESEILFLEFAFSEHQN